MVASSQVVLVTIILAGVLGAFSGQSGFASSAAQNGVTIKWLDRGPQAGEIDQLAFDTSNPNVIFAGGSYAGLYRSTDGGSSWSPDLPTQEYQVTSLATVPAQPGHVFVTVAGKLFTSANDGVSWSQDNSCAGYASKYYVSPVNSRVRLLICRPSLSDDLLVSSDNGTTWKTAPVDFPNLILYDVAASQNTIYALGFSNSNPELFRSIDGGNNWTGSVVNFRFFDHSPLAVSPSNASIVLVGGTTSLHASADGGKTWNDVSDEPIQSVSMGFVAFDPENGSVAYAGRIGLLRSTNGGESFQPLGSAVGEVATGITSYHADPGAIAFDRGLGTVYLGTDGGVYATRDSGATWAWLPNGMKNGLVLATAVDPSAPNHIIVTRQDWGPTQTRDGGMTWNDLQQPYFEWGTAQFDPTNSSIVYLTGGGGVWKSTNGGQSFFQTNIGLSTLDKGFYPNGMTIRVNPLVHTEVWLAAGNYFYKSVDSGAHWQNVTITPNEGQFPAVGDVAPMGSIVYATYVPTGNVYSTVWRSEDGGVNWTKLSLPSDCTFSGVEVDPLNPSAVFAIGTVINSALPVVYASSNQGNTFVPLVLPPDGQGSPELAAGGPPSDMRLVLGSTLTGEHVDLYESITNGSSWVPITSNMNVTVLREILIPTFNPDSVFVATLGGGLESANITTAELNAITTTGSSSSGSSTSSTSYTSTSSSSATVTTSSSSSSSMSAISITSKSGLTTSSRASSSHQIPSSSSGGIPELSDGSAFVILSVVTIAVSYLIIRKNIRSQ